MKKIFLLTLLMSSLSVSVFAQKIVVSVPGMVCQLCVHGMKKAFKNAVKNPDRDVVVNLDTKKITLNLSKTLSDEEIKARVKNTGYNVEKIERSPQ